MAVLRQYSSPPGTYFDAFPILLLSTQSLASLARRAPGSVVDVRRFRPNIVVDAPGDQEFPELGWVGQELRIGDVVLQVVAGCPRCVMISRPQGELPEDRDLQRVVTRQLDHTMGVYCSVSVPGALHVGEQVHGVD